MQLRPYQQDTIDRLKTSFRSGHKKIVLQLCTGGGKTFIAGTIIEKALAKGNRVWFICDNIELVNQASESFDDLNIDHGIIQGDNERTDYSKPLQVVTAQTLSNRWARFDQNRHYLPDLIIIDEAHVCYKSHNQLIGMLPKVPVIGLTATPYTKGLAKTYSDMVIGASVAKLTQDGYLVPVEAYGCVQADLSSVKKKGNGDWQDKPLAKAVTTITGELVSTWFRLGEDRQTLAYCVNVQHSKDVCSAFLSAGVKAEQIDGFTDKDERKAIIRRFKSGETKLLTSVGTLTKGFNATIASCLILARPTKSKMLHFQILGRVLRTHENKHNSIILDHSGNISRLGFPEDNQPSGLDDGNHGNSADRAPKEKKERKNCPECDRIPVGITCVCGHSFAPPANVEVLDGTLKKLSKAAHRNKTHSHDQKQAFYSGCLQYVSDKGKKEGYAANLYKSKYGVWPNHYTKVKGPITQAVRTQVQANNIRYSHSKGRKYNKYK